MASKPQNSGLWGRAKAAARAKFDVYPSAYANAWASKCYKSKGGKWKKVNESIIEQTISSINKVTYNDNLYGLASRRTK